MAEDSTDCGPYACDEKIRIVLVFLVVIWKPDQKIGERGRGLEREIALLLFQVIVYSFLISFFSPGHEFRFFLSGP